MHPFRVAVADAQIEDLRTRLRRTRWPDQPSQPWADGTDLGALRDLVDYWGDGFDWRAQEEVLNRQEQFLVDVGPLRVHCGVHRGRDSGGRALILVNGWPSTWYEHYRLAPLLSHPPDGSPGYDVVCPSLPGYGFSDRPTAQGTSPQVVARLLVRLMAELGYERFGTHGTDWGELITTLVALDYPERIVGVHLDRVPPLGVDDDDYRRQSQPHVEDERAYLAIQATRPQTLAYALNDSPAGLAAWIVEKWRAWSDCDGDLWRRFTRDEILTTISIYWFTETTGSSARLYHEMRAAPLDLAPGARVAAPAAFCIFPVPAPTIRPRRLAELRYDVRRWDEMPYGGHFPALEATEVLAAHMVSFFGELDWGPASR